MKFKSHKSSQAKYIFGLMLVFVLFFSCTISTTKTDPIWTVTVDLNGGTGLTKFKYDVTDEGTLDTLEGTPVYNVTKDMLSPPPHVGRVLTGYKTDIDTDFVLGKTIVTRDVTIVAQWGFDPLLDCTSVRTSSLRISDYAQSGDIVGIACRLKQGDDLNYQYITNNNWTVLHFATDNNQLEAVKYIVASGASVNTANVDGETALHLAAQHGDIDIVKYLATRPGINLSSRTTGGNFSGKTALGIAKAQELTQPEPQKTNYTEISTYLTSLGAKE